MSDESRWEELSLNRFLSPAELAEYLSVPLKTIYGWNYRGEGPPFVRLGRLVRYRRRDVERWLVESEQA